MYYGGLLQYMEYNNTPVYFTHAPDGTPMGMLTGGKAYFYIVNLQGDVVGIVDQTGNLVVSYTYDAWGNPLSTTLADGNAYAATVAALNPIRYRGYVYDAETSLYYLQSRYYNPTTGRFLNADAFASTGQGFVGNNMFAYCNNNPVNYVDNAGKDAIWIQEKDSAKGFGHSGLLVEDANGDWWFFYWGPAEDNTLKMVTVGTKAQCILIKVDISGKDLTSVEGIASVLASIDDNNNSNDAKFAANRAKLVTGIIYYEGDYTKTYNYLSKLKKSSKKPKYHLITQNCVQQTWKALRKSNYLFYSSIPVIPNEAYVRANLYKYAEYSAYLPRAYNFPFIK